jgi:hypothetical protein
MVASTAPLRQKSASITFNTALLLQPMGRHKTQPYTVPQTLVASIAGRPQHTAGKCFRDALFASTLCSYKEQQIRLEWSRVRFNRWRRPSTARKVSGKNCLLELLGGRSSQQWNV